MDPYSAAANYGVLSYDRTHIFNAAYVINLPAPVKDNKFLGGVVNGWVLSGITQWQSGPPLQPNTAGTLNAGFPTQLQPSDWSGYECRSGYRAHSHLRSAQRAEVRSVLQPELFRASYRRRSKGDIIWPYIKGPAFFNSDLAIYKDFLFKEHQKVEFRFSAFNFLNHPLSQFDQGGASDVNLNFSGPNSTLSQTNLQATHHGVPVVQERACRA